MFGGNYFGSIYFADYFGGFNINSPTKYIADEAFGTETVTITNLTPPVINDYPKVKYYVPY